MGFASAGSALGPKDLKPPMFRDCAWLDEAEKLDGLMSELLCPLPLPLPLADLECSEILGVLVRPAEECCSFDGRGLGLGGLERMLATLELLALLNRSFTIFLSDFLMAGPAGAGMELEPLRIFVAGAVIGLSRGTGLPA